MPTKHPSAWRLNKAEEKSVDSDLAVWEASQPQDLSQEELQLAEEKKRLVRVIQEAKHQASLNKQQTAGARVKAAASKASSPAGASTAPQVPGTGDGSTCNGDYFESLKQDLAVIEKALGSKLKEQMPTPIAAMAGEKTGVQDSHSRVSNKVCHRFCFPLRIHHCCVYTSRTNIS